MSKITYKDSGVDLDVYAESMSRLPRLLNRTHCPRVLPWANGFAGLFQLDFPGKLFSRQYTDPILVSCTDGVGTKLKVAQMTGRHSTVGIDLVAMCVNDALCCGAEPLFFLDYVAMGADDPALLEQIVEGISAGCVESAAALVGGETAIMPDLYQPGDYDLAGFCVGVVDRPRLVDGKTIEPGDVVLGLASSGIHSNGFSLVRKIVFKHAGLAVDAPVAQCGGQTVGALLLEPTRLYVRPVQKLLAEFAPREVIRGIAHITGGGLCENLSRILPPTIDCEISRGSWPVPPVFPWLQQLGDVDDAEMDRVFNMGVGLCLVVAADQAREIQARLAAMNIDCWPIGKAVAGSGEANWE